MRGQWFTHYEGNNSGLSSTHSMIDGEISFRVGNAAYIDSIDATYRLNICSLHHAGRSSSLHEVGHSFKSTRSQPEVTSLHAGLQCVAALTTQLHVVFVV